MKTINKFITVVMLAGLCTSTYALLSNELTINSSIPSEYLWGGMTIVYLWLFTIYANLWAKGK